VGTTKTVAPNGLAMPAHQTHYEELLASFSHHRRAAELLRHHRPYFEKIPSIRRSEESIITIPLPIIKVKQRLDSTPHVNHDTPYELITIPCDLALLMCDPEWQIKTGVEIFIFIHRFGEELSDLLRRWRETQVLLSRGYSWEMPLRYQHIFSEGADKAYPLFVLSPETSERIRRGLQGATLPQVTLSVQDESNFIETPDSSGNKAHESNADIEDLGFNLPSDSSDSIDSLESEKSDSERS
jgi:hypothetical protein